MKKINSIVLAAPLAFFIACSGSSNKDKIGRAKQFPKPGTIVAAAETPIAEDSLNHATFSVKVIADSNVSSGIYDVDVDYGNNFAEGQITMPKGGEDFKPVIRKGDAPNIYIIGFRAPADSTFYDYFQVTSNRKATQMEYIKAYSFTSE